MKRYVRITLLLSLLISAPVRAAEEHFHYHITFLIALAVGWSWEEAQLIASADLAVDTNETTVASLEITGRSGFLHPSPKSLRFHCFSATDDRRASRNHTRNPDVLENLSSLEARANDAVDRASHSQNPLDISQALVAIGVYLHCQQDSWFHSGFGGQWDGHALESLFAMMLRIPDPDQAAARPAKAERALDEMLQKLISFRQRWGSSTYEIATNDLVPLKRILTHRLTTTMTKRERAACDQRLAGRWLSQLLSEQNRLFVVPTSNVKDGLTKPSSRCRRVQPEFELSTAAWVVAPPPLTLKLGLDGSLRD